MAKEFCYLNSKGNRKHLVTTLYAVPWQSLELIPNYARLAATLIVQAGMADIGTQLVDKLKDEFRYHQRKKNQHRLESKLRNIRFISELTKFGVAPPQVSLDCLKVCMNDFKGHNVNISTTMLETCGRFLYKTPHTHARIANSLEVMMKLKQAQNMDSNAETMISNAYYCVKPIARAKRVQKQHPLLYKYCQRLLFLDLKMETVSVNVKIKSSNGKAGRVEVRKEKKDTCETVLRILRRLPWYDPELGPHVEDYVRKCVLKVARHRNMGLVCDVLKGLEKWHDRLAVRCVDDLIDLIRSGLDKNDFRRHQLLVSGCRMLGNMYLYRLVQSALVFDTLYSLIEYGHEVPFHFRGDHHKACIAARAGSLVNKNSAVSSGSNSNSNAPTGQWGNGGTSGTVKHIYVHTSNQTRGSLI